MITIVIEDEQIKTKKRTFVYSNSYKKVFYRMRLHTKEGTKLLKNGDINNYLTDFRYPLNLFGMNVSRLTSKVTRDQRIRHTTLCG